MGGQWRLRTSIRGFKNEVLRVSHFPNYSKLRTSTPPNLHFFKEAGSKVNTSGNFVNLVSGFCPTDCSSNLYYFMLTSFILSLILTMGKVTLPSFS